MRPRPWPGCSLQGTSACCEPFILLLLLLVSRTAGRSKVTFKSRGALLPMQGDRSSSRDPRALGSTAGVSPLSPGGWHHVPSTLGLPRVSQGFPRVLHNGSCSRPLFPPAPLHKRRGGQSPEEPEPGSAPGIPFLPVTHRFSPQRQRRGRHSPGTSPVAPGVPGGPGGVMGSGVMGSGLCLGVPWG